jgi:hypothetical protein
MAIKRPDIYEHNNPNLPIADSDFVRGGIRSAVQSLSDLYALTTKASQLKQHSTQIYVSGENKIYLLKDINNIGNANGWEEFNFGGGGGTLEGVVYTTGNQTITGIKTFNERIVSPEIRGLGLGGSLRKIDFNSGHLYSNTSIALDYFFRILSGNWKLQHAPTVSGVNLITTGDFINLELNIDRALDNFSFVYATGDQTIDGIKNFTSRPTINNIEVSLSGESLTFSSPVVYSTGNQIISGVKSFSNETVFQDNLLHISQASGEISGTEYTGYYDGGQFWGRTKLSQNNTRLVNIGNNWIVKETGRSWKSIAMSSNGQYQTAIVNTGQIYVSNDYRNTWTPKESVRSWQDITMSVDGKYQCATVDGGQIYISNNYGNTWTAKESDRDWYGIAISSNGKYQSATVDNDQIYISNDYGNTWIAKDTERAWRNIALSSDGKYQTAIVLGGQIYTSNDYGETWIARELNRNWSSIAISADGKYQSATVDNGLIYVSNNYGITWRVKDSVRFWSGIAMSADGKYQVATVAGGLIYISNDYGNTWIGKNSGRVWRNVAMSSDGKYITAIVDDDKIYTSVADEFIDGNLFATNFTENLVNSDGTIARMIRLTQAEYNALSPKEPTTFYIIVG